MKKGIMKFKRSDPSLMVRDASVLSENDPNEKFITAAALTFLERGLDFAPSLSREALDLIFAALGFEESFGFLKEFEPPRKGKVAPLNFETFLDRTHCDQPQDLDDLARETINWLRREQKILLSPFSGELSQKIASYIAAAAPLAAGSDLAASLAAFGDNFGLAPVERELARFLLVMKSLRPADAYFDSHLDCFALHKRRLLAAILDVDTAELKKAFSGQLFKLELCDFSRGGSIALESEFETFLETPGDLSHNEAMEKAQAPQISADDHFIDARTRAMLTSLLAQKGDSPTHILFYGPPGVGKTQLARALAQASGATAYEVLPEVPNLRGSHRGNLLKAYNLTRHGEGSVLIVDECENLLTTKSPWPFLFGGRAESRDKSWLDYFLEQPRARCIWICNDISGLDPAVQRRFSFSLEFPKFGRRQRVKIWERSREELKGSGGEMLSDAEIGRLAETYEVNAGVINQSLRKSLEAGADSESKLVAYLESHLRAHLALSGQTARRVKVTPDFRLSALNTSLPAAEIEQMLAKWREQNWGQDLGSRLGLSFLFHGLPGSGKTELGRYLGQHLDMEVIHLQVSDILSKYVGESEKRVAEAFREAEAREAILHIDEVESFFLNRDKAVHSWETTLVNEFLTGLENFRGVFIGSTNRIGDLDAAALSRFSLKVEFKPITSAARTELFQAILSPLTAEPLTAGEEQVLHQLGGLTPRDFKVAALQYRWRPSGSFTNLDLIEALKADVELRERQKEKTSAKPAASPSAIN